MMIHTITTKWDLVFEGQCVGKRVLVTSEDKEDSFYNMYDMDLDTFDLIYTDFRAIPTIIVRDIDSAPSLTLLPKGEKLVTSDGKDYPELTYSKVAELSGFERWKDLQGTDVKLKKLYNEYNHRYFNGQLPFS